MIPAQQRIRTAEHSSAQGSWRMALLAPAADVSPYVDRYNAYAERSTGFARRREVPSGLATMVFNLGAELRVEHPTATRSTFAGGTGFFAGLNRRHAVTETNGAQDGVQVMLTPLGARRLLAMPLEEVGETLVDPVDLFGAPARDMIARMQDDPSPAGRLAILERMVEARIAAGTPLARDLAFACRRLQAGCRGIEGLAAEIGCSRKHLTTRFRREFGLSPKLLARILRFSRAKTELENVQLAAGRSNTNLAQVALACGYADQSHMTRDFREFSGSPPAALALLCLPDEGGIRD